MNIGDYQRVLGSIKNPNRSGVNYLLVVIPNLDDLTLINFNAYPNATFRPTYAEGFQNYIVLLRMNEAILK